MPPPLRIGTVPYLVARPLDDGLGDEPGIRLERDVPARLVERLRDGDLDVALVSSIELFRRPGYRWLDGVAVAGEAGVSSVCVFLRRPLEEVRTVALDPASRAAAALTQVVWPVPAGGRRPEFVELEPGADPRAAGTDAWLRIGDAALREMLAEDAPPAFLPSAAFTEATGLPFPFAVWVVGPDVDPAALRDALPAFGRARARGAARVRELAHEAAAAWSIPEEAARRYLAEEILYEPEARLRPALLAFRDRAAELGLCDGGLEPSPAGRVDPVGSEAETPAAEEPCPGS